MIYVLQGEPASTNTNTFLGILPPGIVPDKDPRITIQEMNRKHGLEFRILLPRPIIELTCYMCNLRLYFSINLQTINDLNNLKHLNKFMILFK